MIQQHPDPSWRAGLSDSMILNFLERAEMNFPDLSFSKEWPLPAFIQVDATDMRKYLGYAQDGTFVGDASYGDLGGVLAGDDAIMKFKELQDTYHLLMKPIIDCENEERPYTSANKTALNLFISTVKSDLETSATKKEKYLDDKRCEYARRNDGGDPHGLQKTYLTCVTTEVLCARSFSLFNATRLCIFRLARRASDLAAEAVAMCSKITLITSKTALDVVDAQILKEHMQAIFLELRSAADHYLSILIQTSDKNISIPQ